MRPTDLARRHGISTQAVRNYEADGCLPPAARTRSGYRVYTEAHAAALDAYLALVRAYGHATGGRIMNALHAGALDEALTAVDRGHAQSLRDRETLDAVRDAVGHLLERPPVPRTEPPAAGPGGSRTVGELAHRLGVTRATLRAWEAAGILAPARDPATGHRAYRADDVRDAELAHLLRRGGYPLERIAEVVRQIRTAGGTEALGAALEGWEERLTRRRLAMLDAAARLGRYLELLPLQP
ncbi:TioE family transcriptional regulator [Streptomyces sp. NPDC048659]|uniref:TioE family transcriptional regulator n=1 Tax=Streptomyces sp. NPDC048659 TaxID=3155489 RepID=UPI0034148489